MFDFNLVLLILDYLSVRWLVGKVVFPLLVLWGPSLHYKILSLPAGLRPLQCKPTTPHNSLICLSIVIENQLLVDVESGNCEETDGGW